MITGGPTGRVLRDDTERLAMVMAGTIARYYRGRVRAETRIKGLVNFGSLLGHIVTYLDDGGSAAAMQAPITSVAWSFPEKGPPTTTLSIGFAG